MAVAAASGGIEEPSIGVDSGIEVLPDDVVLDLRVVPPRVVLESGSLPLNPDRPGWARRASKRTFDVVGALGLSVLFAPAAVVCALAVAVSSPGPVIYRSERVARSGTFHALKFRSMHVDGDAVLAEHLRSHPEAAAEYHGSYKLANDPRVTRVGRWIRRTSLDELPQLVNILRGEMSLVGPRPKVIGEHERYGDTLPTVLRVKPGLTGLWQVSGRSYLPFRDRVLLDVEYALNPTMTNDIRICLKTAGQMMTPEDSGAY